MRTVLVVFELLVALGLIVCILLQRSEGGGLGIGGGGGGGGMGGLFSPRGAADVMTRTTGILAGLFFIICLGLNLLALHGVDRSSILDTTAPVTAPARTAPATPVAPPAPSVPTAP